MKNHSAERAYSGAFFVVVMGTCLAGVCLASACGSNGGAGGAGVGGTASSSTTTSASSTPTSSTGTGACTSGCEDECKCTIDACTAGTCTHTVGPNSGPTACDPGTYCEPGAC